jgi:hypothetical protein
LLNLTGMLETFLDDVVSSRSESEARDAGNDGNRSIHVTGTL